MPFAIGFHNFLLADSAAFTSGFFIATVVWGFSLRRSRSATARAEGDSSKAIVEQSPDVLLRFDAALVCNFASPASVGLFGRSMTEIVGRSMIEFVSEDEDKASLEAAIARARTGEVGAEVVFRSASGGEQVWIEARLGMADAEGRIVAALRDVSVRKTAELALRVANLELNKLAGNDGLTDLANRRRFDETLQNECRRASRNAAPLSLLLLDVDRFKAYNDCYGHQAGDSCLKEIGTALRAMTTRPVDMAARFGGEEFAIMLPGVDERESAEMAERIRTAIAALRLPHEGNAEAGCVVTVSIGCATVRPTLDSFRQDSGTLISGADRALYDAKRLGRNRIVAPALKPNAEATVERLATDNARLARLDAFRTAGVFQPSANLDRVARMAAMLLGMPMAFVALLDREDSVVIGHHGMTGDPPVVPHACCAHLLGARGIVVVPEAGSDPRFREFARERGLAFLAAAPLLSGDDLQHIGALWVVDRQARGSLDESKRVLLSRLATLAIEDIESRAPLPVLATEAA